VAGAGVFGSNGHATTGLEQSIKMLLFYGSVVVGEITDYFEHQGTWFGSFRAGLPVSCDPTTERLREFIEFCKDWYARSGSESGADVSEFDRFQDIVACGSWSTRTEGEVFSVLDAPMFAGGFCGLISWAVSE